ncbi:MULTISPECIES: extracellular solute-binding protein [unclassified Clostridium]|uniref:ABC transporter substrate-binding protein n=1 Tax=unclassified Clostridium TaxID=2614128 RepID=UPI0002981FCB|nr:MULTISPECIES: extracellular solute-binding protein [unclassified Clostridium]EKQ57583.1 MAG: ABC-type sugar transport system, periplasmic component [Clostridium sp. Maddingley MBC34-26]
MKFKKIMAAVVTGMMAFSLMACGSSSSSSSSTSSSSKGKDDKTITIWAWDDTFNIKAANMAKERYLKNHPDVTINVVSMAQDDVVQKLNTSLSSGTYDGLPNVVLIEDYRIQNYLQSYPGEIKDLSGKVDKTKFADYKLNVMSDGSKFYGVPFDSGVAALFYRTDLIEQAGYKKEDMNDLTWEKFIEIGKAVKAKTGKAMLTIDPSDLNQLRIMMQSAGSWYVKEDGKTVNISGNQALKDAINIYKQMVDAGITKQVSGWDAFLAAFQKGDVASVPSGCWISSSIQKSEDQKGKWAVTAIPKLGANSKSVNASNSGGSSWYVLDKVGNSDLAADFLASTFASDKDLMNDLVPAIGLVSTLKEASTSDNYSKPVDFYGGQEVFKDMANWTTKVPAVNYGLYTYQLESVMSEGMQAIVAGANVDETLQKTQAQAEAAVSK